MEIHRKLSFNYHQILTLSVLLIKLGSYLGECSETPTSSHWNLTAVTMWVPTSLRQIKAKVLADDQVVSIQDLSPLPHFLFWMNAIILKGYKTKFKEKK